MAYFDSLEQMRKNCICLNLRQVARIMTRRCDEANASTGLRPTQMPILFYLMLNGEMQMGMLADEMAIDKSTLSRKFGVLEARGLVARSNIDGRTVSASITASGEEALESACKIWKKTQDDMLSGVGKDSWLSAFAVLPGMAGNK